MIKQYEIYPSIDSFLESLTKNRLWFLMLLCLKKCGDINCLYRCILLFLYSILKIISEREWKMYICVHTHILNLAIAYTFYWAIIHYNFNWRISLIVVGPEMKLLSIPPKLNWRHVCLSKYWYDRVHLAWFTTYYIHGLQRVI